MNAARIYACGRVFTPRGYSQHVSRSPRTHRCTTDTAPELPTQFQSAGSSLVANPNVFPCDLGEAVAGDEAESVTIDNGELW